MKAAKPVKIFFDLDQDESGYPPTTTESLWCIPTGRGTYIIDNIPFFAREISLGDEVSAKKSTRNLKFENIVRQSGNSTVRVLFKRPDMLKEVRKKLNDLGCDTELMEQMSLLAVSMSPRCKIAEALNFLDKEAEKGNVGIEESAVRYQ